MRSRQSDSDALETGDATTPVTRRGALALGAAASALLLTGRPAAASIRTGAGIAGGGLVTWDTGEAELSVFGSRFVDDETDVPVIFGSLRWADAAGFTLTSEAITGYGPYNPAATTRRLDGVVRNSDSGTLHEFVLLLVEGGGPGEGLDQVQLVVSASVLAATPESGPASTPDGGTPGTDADETLATPAGEDLGSPVGEDLGRLEPRPAGAALIEVDGLLEVGDLQLLTFEFPA